MCRINAFVPSNIPVYYSGRKYKGISLTNINTNCTLYFRSNWYIIWYQIVIPVGLYTRPVHKNTEYVSTINTVLLYLTHDMVVGAGCCILSTNNAGDIFFLWYCIWYCSGQSYINTTGILLIAERTEVVWVPSAYPMITWYFYHDTTSAAASYIISCIMLTILVPDVFRFVRCQITVVRGTAASAWHIIHIIVYTVVYTRV